ncbi:hypothetical protein AWENTII_008148 [Aspergillus wentii]
MCTPPVVIMDKDAFLNEPKKKTDLEVSVVQFMQNYPNAPQTEHHTVFPLHANCWTMIIKFFGPEIEVNLGFLTEALESRTDEDYAQEGFFTPQHIATRNEPGCDMREFVQNATIPEDFFSETTFASPGLKEAFEDMFQGSIAGGTLSMIPGFTQLVDTFMKPFDAVRSAEEPSFFTDPVNISEVLGIVQTSRHRRQITDAKRAERESKMAEAGNGNAADSKSFLPKLPGEIHQLILEYLNLEDIENVRECFEWDIPQSFFYKDVRKDFFFEVRDFGVDDLDWGYFNLQTEKMMKHTQILSNRKRINWILEDTKVILNDIWFDSLVGRREGLDDDFLGDFLEGLDADDEDGIDNPNEDFDDQESGEEFDDEFEEGDEPEGSANEAFYDALD